MHGILLINKSNGITSRRLAEKVGRLCNQKTTGHSGSLDPMAEGLMIILLGRACKLSRYLMAGDKTYELGIQFGAVTDTWDKEGTIIRQSSTVLEKSQIEKEIKNHRGAYFAGTSYFCC